MSTVRRRSRHVRSSSSTDFRLYPTRFRLFNGEHLTLPCSRNESIGDIIDKIAKRKGIFDHLKSKYVIKLPEGEIFFEPTETFGDFLDMCRVFSVFGDDRTRKTMPEAALIERDDVGDAIQRKTKISKRVGKVHWQGYLDLLGSGRTKVWKQRYLVLQDNSLFFYEVKENYESQKRAIFVLPMGSCIASAWPPMTLKSANRILRTSNKPRARISSSQSPKRRIKTPKNNIQFLFELHAQHVGQRKMVFMSSTKKDIVACVDAIFAVNFNRVKAIAVHSIQELLSRKSLSTEGIFRVSGSKEIIFSLKKKYDLANYPDLTKVEDVHVISGLLKLSLREMESPLLTFKLYGDFLKAVNGTDKAAKITSLRTVVNKLPPANRSFLEYLMKFLRKVVQQSDQNKMSHKNLAIVMAPNLLRCASDSESCESPLLDSRKINTVVQLLIEESATICGGIYHRASVAYRTTKRKRRTIVLRERTGRTISITERPNLMYTNSLSRTDSGKKDQQSPGVARERSSGMAINKRTDRSHDVSAISQVRDSKPLKTEAKPLKTEAKPRSRRRDNFNRQSQIAMTQSNTFEELFPSQNQEEKKISNPVLKRITSRAHTKTMSVHEASVLGFPPNDEDYDDNYELDEGDEGDDDYGIERSMSANPEVVAQIDGWQLQQDEQMDLLRKKVGKGKSVDQYWDNVFDALYPAESVPDDIKRRIEDCLATQQQTINNAITELDKLTKTLENLTNDAHSAIGDPLLEIETKDDYEEIMARRGTFSRTEDTEEGKLHHPFEEDLSGITESEMTEKALGGYQTQINEVFAKAIFDHNVQEEGDLAIKKGDILIVLDMSETEGWWEGKKISDNSIGFFPHNYVEIIPSPHLEK